MDFNSHYLSNKNNLTKMKQPPHIRSYGTTSNPDLSKKFCTSHPNEYLKLITPVGLSVPNRDNLHVSKNLNTALNNSSKHKGLPKIISLIGIKSVKILGDQDPGYICDSCRAMINRQSVLMNNWLFNSSQSMPSDLQKCVNNSEPRKMSKWKSILPMIPEFFDDINTGTDSEMDSYTSETMDMSKNNGVLKDLSILNQKEGKLLNTHRDLNKPKSKNSDIYSSEIDKFLISLADHMLVCNKPNVFFPECTENKIGKQGCVINPCTSNNKNCCQYSAVQSILSNLANDICKKMVNKSCMANDNIGSNNCSKPDQNNIELIGKNCFQNMTTLTMGNLSKKEHCFLTGGDDHTEADTKKETEEIIARVSLPDSNGTQLAECQIDKIESNITEINAECEGVTGACVDKITKPKPKYHIGFVDQTLSLNTDKHCDDNQLISDGKSHEEPLSVDIVDYACIVKRGPHSGQASHDKSPAMPNMLRRIDGQINHSKYSPSASRIRSEIVDKTYQVSEGIDAILKRLGRHDDKLLNDTMKSHDNSLHRLSAGDCSHPGQQKVSRFLTKRAQEKEAEAVRKAQKEAQEQIDSVLSCEDKMKHLKQLVSSKKSDSFSENIVRDGSDSFQDDLSVKGKPTCHSQSTVDSPIIVEPHLSDNKPLYNSDDISSKQNSHIKSDHNFYHTEAPVNQDCFCESRSNDTTLGSVDKGNVCKSLTIATETEIIDEKEIKCQIIENDPVLVQIETINDEVNIANNKESLVQFSEMCSTSSGSQNVVSDCDSQIEAISLDDKQCETRNKIDESVERQDESSSSMSVLTSHLEISVDSNTTETKLTDSAPIDCKPESEPEKPVVIDKCEDKMAKLKAMLAEKKSRKLKKCITKETENVNVHSDSLTKSPASIADVPSNILSDEKNSLGTNNKITLVEGSKSTFVNSSQKVPTKTSVKSVELKKDNPGFVKSVGIKQLKVPLKTVEAKQTTASVVKTVEPKQTTACLVKTVESKQTTASLVKTVEPKQTTASFVKTVEPKQTTASLVKTADAKQNKVPPVKITDAKQNKTTKIESLSKVSFKPATIKQDKTTNVKTTALRDKSNDQNNMEVLLNNRKELISSEDNKNEENYEREALSKNDVEVSSPTDVVPTDSKSVRVKCGKGKSGKKGNKKHKNEHSSKRDRHKERNDHKRDIQDDLTFDTELEQATDGPLYFSTDTMQLHVEPKKPRRGKKNKLHILDKCVDLISSIPAMAAICKPNLLEIEDENPIFKKNSEEFVMVDREELLPKEKELSNRIHLPSECDSEDSFVICFQGSQEDLQNTAGESDDDDDFSDSVCSETGSSDDEDDSSTGSYCSDEGDEDSTEKTDVLVGIMKKTRFNRDSPGKSGPTVVKQVSFTASPPKVHKMITWAYAYRQARIGTWERCARDAERFRQRITDTSLCLDWVLKREHRARVYFQRFRPLLMRAIREEKEAKAKKAKEDKEKAIREKEMEEELLKQKEIEEKEKAEQLEKDSTMVVDNVLNDKNHEKIEDFKVDLSSIDCNNSDLVVMDSINDKIINEDEKLLIVKKNEKCDNGKILKLPDGRNGGSGLVHIGKNCTFNIKSVSPTK